MTESGMPSNLPAKDEPAIEATGVLEVEAAAVARPATRYPRMMDPSAAVVEAEEAEEVPVPALLRPEGLTKSTFEERSRKFDSAFGPLTELSAEDVVVGCSAHGSELVAQSRGHIHNFTTHLRNIDTSNGAQSALQSLEAGQLVQLPVGAAKACLGTGLYGVAAGARFGPKVLQLCKQKAADWHIAKNTQVAARVVADKAKKGLDASAAGIHAAWKWIKAKVGRFYGVEPASQDEDRVDV